jgi:superfamily II DNA/RNA helicase
VPSEQKVEQLLAFLHTRTEEKGIVYFLTCASVEYMATTLPQLPSADNMPILMMHGGMKQPKARPWPSRHFRDGQGCVC